MNKCAHTWGRCCFSFAHLIMVSIHGAFPDKIEATASPRARGMSSLPISGTSPAARQPWTTTPRSPPRPVRGRRSGVDQRRNMGGVEGLRAAARRQAVGRNQGVILCRAGRAATGGFARETPFTWAPCSRRGWHGWLCVVWGPENPPLFLSKTSSRQTTRARQRRTRFSSSSASRLILRIRLELNRSSVRTCAPWR